MNKNTRAGKKEAVSTYEITEDSKAFYERYQFPGDVSVNHDGVIFYKSITRAIDEYTDHDRGCSTLKVMDAGCGTGNTTIALARLFPQLEIVGVDQSNGSLKQAGVHAQREGITNVKFMQHNLLRSFENQMQYDIVLCLGVLHHTADMKNVLLNLKEVMSAHGLLYLWIYGRYGRIKHSMNVRALHMLRDAVKSQDEIALAKDFVSKVNGGNALDDLLVSKYNEVEKARFINNSVWIADQFFNPYEMPLDWKELDEIISGAGFNVHMNLGRWRKSEEIIKSPLVLNAFRQLGHKEQDVVLDLILKPEHYFVVLRPTKK